jgi:hypothetical protein
MPQGLTRTRRDSSADLELGSCGLRVFGSRVFVDATRLNEARRSQPLPPPRLPRAGVSSTYEV